MDTSTAPLLRASSARRAGAALVAAGAFVVLAAFPAAAQNGTTEVAPTDPTVDTPAVTEADAPVSPAADAVGITAVALDVNPTTIDAGGSVTFTVGTLPTNQGVYVNFCENPADAGVRTQGAGLRCASVGGDEAMPGMSGFWVVNPGEIPYPGLEFGDGIQATGTPITMGPLPSSFSGVDCTVVTCGVYAIRDHRGLADTSLDTFVPVTFGTGGGSGGGGTGGGGGGGGGVEGVGTGPGGAAGGTGTAGAGGAAGSTLADTGMSNGLLFVVGALLVGAGTVVLAVNRRRTHHA